MLKRLLKNLLVFCLLLAGSFLISILHANHENNEVTKHGASVTQELSRACSGVNTNICD